MFVLLRLNVLDAPKKDENLAEDTAVIRAAVNDSCLCHSRDILGGDLRGLLIDHPVQTPRQCQGPLSHGVCKQMELMGDRCTPARGPMDMEDAKGCHGAPEAGERSSRPRCIYLP